MMSLLHTNTTVTKNIQEFIFMDMTHTKKPLHTGVPLHIRVYTYVYIIHNNIYIYHVHSVRRVHSSGQVSLCIIHAHTYGLSLVFLLPPSTLLNIHSPEQSLYTYVYIYIHQMNRFTKTISCCCCCCSCFCCGHSFH